MIAKMRDDGHSAKRRKWTKVLALVVGVALADASFVSVHAQEARNYLIHRDWFYWPTDPSEMTFRKYLPVEGGYKNIINLHCPRSRRGDMFTTIDLTSVPETSKFISELRDGKTQLMFKEGNDNIGIPLRSFIQATYEVGRIGTQYGFDRILTGGQDFNFRTYADGKMAMQISFDDDLGEQLRRVFNQPDVLRTYNARRIELYSTVDVISMCAKYQGAK